MPEFTQGICEDGAAILSDGIPMTPDEIITALKALDFLVDLKRIKNDPEFKGFYKNNKNSAWHKARQALSLQEKS